MKHLKTIFWLNEHLMDSNLILLDASQQNNVSGDQSLLKGKHIVRSQLFDIKTTFSDTSSPFPNTIPSELQFQQEARKLGINNDSVIVIYDNIGIYSSPRAWWLFRLYGHKNVYVLDGGLPEWVKEGHEITSHLLEPERGNFKAVLNSELVKTFDTIKNNIPVQNFKVVDARSKDRFEGNIKEPRKGLRSGSIPKSVNLPYTDVLEYGKLKSTKELDEIFSSFTKTDKALVFSCGSGVTACILLLAFTETTGKNAAIYDGSWTEWGSLYKF
jgi:thiosulfate/3-mercaptopyruvate sulfurtransferase